MFIEGIMFFAFSIFYPVLTTSLFEQDPLLSIKAKSIQVPLSVAFVIFTGGTVGFATIQPDNSLSTWFFAGVSGIRFGGPLILIITGIQLATPHALIATATALAITSRAVLVAVFTVIFSIAFTERLQPNIASQVPVAALTAGLPVSSVEAFVGALAARDMAALSQIQGVTPQIIAAGVQALKQAFADSIWVVFIIAAPFRALACLLCWFLDDQSEEMNYRVNALIEDLHARA